MKGIWDNENERSSKDGGRCVAWHCFEPLHMDARTYVTAQLPPPPPRFHVFCILILTPSPLPSPPFSKSHRGFWRLHERKAHNCKVPVTAAKRQRERGRERERPRERGREREVEREREIKHTDRHTDTQTHTDTHAHTQTHTHTNTHTHTHTHKEKQALTLH